jgi:hypothetical protein
LAKNDYYSFCRDEERTEQTEMRRSLHWFLHESLFSLNSWPHDSALLVIRNDFEKQGIKVAPRFYTAFEEGNELWRAERYGLVDRIIQVGTQAREKSVAEGVTENALSLLDFEIAKSIDQARKQDGNLDKSVSLADKLRQGTFGVVSYTIVPGPKAPKTYNFLTHMEYGMENWVGLLKKKGYGGSVVIAFFNIDSGMYVAETGQCDAFLLQQHGTRPKDDILDEAQEAMERAQAARGNSNVPKLPRFKFDPDRGSYETCGGFDKFLDEHFPLR